MKNTIVLPHSRKLINTERLAAACSAGVPGYKFEDVMSSFLGIRFRSHSRKVIDPAKVTYTIKLWFIGGIGSAGGHLYIPYEDEAKRDADYKYLMQFATNE